MPKIIIFGNSGSGKSTLARRLAELHGAAHLDLDTIAWKADAPGVRAEPGASRAALREFAENNPDWIIEGCYSELLKEASEFCTEMVFLNPGVAACVENCRARPWEPHKYASAEAQDENLKMLLGWVREYETRADEFSLAAHRELFDSFAGAKIELKSNTDAQNYAKKFA